MEAIKREKLLNTCSVIILDLLTPKELEENKAQTLIPYIKKAINKVGLKPFSSDELKSSILEEIRKQIRNPQEAYVVDGEASIDQILNVCSVIIKDYLSSYNQRQNVSIEEIKTVIEHSRIRGWEGDFDTLDNFRVGGSSSIRTLILNRITPPPPKAGRRRSNQSKKRSTTRRGRSSKRKVRKARTTRRR
jgi:hypothetical protein